MAVMAALGLPALGVPPLRPGQHGQRAFSPFPALPQMVGIGDPQARRGPAWST